VLPEPNQRAATRTQIIALGLVFAVLPAASVAGAMALPLLVSIAGGLAALLHWRQLKDSVSVFAALLGVFLAWAALTVMWSPVLDYDRAWKIPLLVGLGCAFALLGARNTPRQVWAWATAAFAILALMLSFEANAGFPLNRGADPSAGLEEWIANPARGSVVLLGLGFGVAAGWLHLKRPLLAALTLLVAGALSASFGMLASVVGFLLGACFFVWALRAPRVAILATTGFFAAWMLLAPFLTPLVTDQSLIDNLPMSAAHRIAIWDHVCALILEKPWFGHGLDSASVVRDEVILRGEAVRALPRHPHSASLHIWYELGAVGAALAAAAIAWGGWRMAHALRAHREVAAAGAGLTAAYGFLANVSFSAWQEWWLAAVLIAASLPAALLRLSVDLRAPGAYRANPTQA
jgi:O-antigen ligase